jgi:hypothetical protein
MADLRSVKAECRQIVNRYRSVRKDDREFPEFFVHCLAGDASKGSVRLYRKAYGEEPYFSKKTVHFESITELALVIECFGRAWDATRPS